MVAETLSEAQKQLWWKCSGVILNDAKLDRSTRLFAVQFGHLWNLAGKPKGLDFSQRELAKVFGMFHPQVHLCLKRLETCEYIKIEDAKHRRKLYIPLEKLTGEKTTDPAPSRGDVIQGTKPSESADYTLSLKSSEQKTSRVNYAELPRFETIKQTISEKFKALKVPQSYLITFETHYESHRIPLEGVLYIVETFARALKTSLKPSKIDGYLIVSFKNQEDSVKRSLLQQQEDVNIRKAKELVNSKAEATGNLNAVLAYRLNTGVRLTKIDFPIDLFKRLNIAGKVLEDSEGVVKRDERFVFYTESDKPFLYCTTLQTIEALQRKGIIIPGVEKLL